MNNFVADRILGKVSREMQPATEIIDHLRKEGYTENFELVNDLLMCAKNHQRYNVKDLQVDEIYRFDDDSDILDGVFIYAIREPWDDLKGIFILR